MRETNAAKLRRWRAANPERAKAYDAAYRERHRDERNARGREYYARNKDAIAARLKAKSPEYLEKRRQDQKQWRLDHPERWAEMQKAYRERNKDKILAQRAARAAAKVFVRKPVAKPVTSHTAPKTAPEMPRTELAAPPSALQRRLQGKVF